jgi:hypothetical protein
MKMHWIDWLVIGTYFAALIVVVWWRTVQKYTAPLNCTYTIPLNS